MPTNSPAINGAQSAMALHPTINATGVKGFLMWMKSDPTMKKVYQQIAPQLPSLLSTYGLAGTKKTLGALSCCLPCSFVSCYESATGSYSCSGNAGYSCSSYEDSITASAPSDATQSSSLMSSLSSLLGIGESAALTANQISQSNAVLNAQLAQAAAGRPPLALTTFGLGTTSGISSTTLLLIGGGLLAVLMLSGKKKSV